MFEMLTQKCRICGGYTNSLLVGERCLACAYTPAGRPNAFPGPDARLTMPELDLDALLAVPGDFTQEARHGRRHGGADEQDYARAPRTMSWIRPPSPDKICR